MPPARKRLAPEDLLGPGEVCRKLGISRATLMRYRDRDDFPQPWREFEMGPAWLASEIEAWKRPSKGRPAAAPR